MSGAHSHLPDRDVRWIGEALGVDRKHVDLKTGHVLIEQQARHDPGEVRIIPMLRTGEDPRSIIGPSLALDALQAYVARRPTAPPGMRLFTRPSGRRLNRARVYAAAHRACDELRVEDMHPQSLRHTSLTIAMFNTGDLFAIMARGGERDVRSARW